MWGPGKGLRGEDGASMEQTVLIMERTMYSIIRWFYLGLLSYFISLISLVWVIFDSRGASVITVAFTVTLVLLVLRLVRIYGLLGVVDYASGRVRGNQVKNIGLLMGDSQLNARGSVSAAFATHM